MANKNGEPTRAEKALQVFVDQLVERMEDASRDLSWTKGWIGGSKRFLGLPQNIKGNTYLGSNALMLQLHTMRKGYNMPVFMTMKQARELGAHVNKGEKSTTVIKAGINVYDKKGNRVSTEFYDKLSDEEKKNYRVRPYAKGFSEFNIDQTNFKEVHPDRYEALLAKFQPEMEVSMDTKGMYRNEALDNVIGKEGAWICPIKEISGSDAFYTPSTNQINIPAKANFNVHPGNVEETFKDGQQFYSTALHEMAHSTGHESQLSREGITTSHKFGDPVYAKEELVAELTAAMVSNAMGFDKRITENSAAYLKSWSSKLKKDPRYIVSVMADVNKASRLEIERIDVQRKALGQKPLMDGNLDGIEERKDNEQQLSDIEKTAAEEKTKLLEGAGLKEKETYYCPLTLAVDEARLGQLWLDGKKDDIIEVLRDAHDQDGVSWRNEEVGSLAYELPKEIIGEDPNFVYALDEENKFVMVQKVAKESVLNRLGDDKLIVEKAPLSVEESENIRNIKAEGNSKEIAKEEDKDMYYSQFDEVEAKYADDFETYRREGNDEALLKLAKEMSHPIDIDQAMTFANLPKEGNSSLLAEDDKIAVVYGDDNQSYTLYNKVSKEQLLRDVKDYGLDGDATDDVKTLAYESVANEFSETKSMPVIQMPNGEDLYVQFNKESGKIEVGNPTNVGLAVSHEFEYATDITLDENLQNVHEQLSEMPEYQLSAEVEQSATQQQDANEEVKTNEASILVGAGLKDKGNQVKATDGEEELGILDKKQHLYSFAYIGSQVEIDPFENLHDEEKYDEMLSLAAKRDMEKKIELKYVDKYEISDERVTENENYSIWHNNQDGSYDLCRKVSDNDIRKEIQSEGGLSLGKKQDYSNTVWRIQRDMVEEEWSKSVESPFVKIGTGKMRKLSYDRENDKILAIDSWNPKKGVVFSAPYDYKLSVKENFENIRQEMSSRLSAESQKNETKIAPRDEKRFYSSFSFMQMQEDTEQFERLRQEGKYDEILSLASEYDQESDIDLDYIKEHAHSYDGDDVVSENEDYAVVYNSEVGGTYDLLKKVSENDIREKIEREGGLEYDHRPEYPKAVWDIQRAMVKDEWKNAPDNSTIEMESGDVLKVAYNSEKDTMEITDPAKGEEPIQTVSYDYTHSVGENFGYAFEEMGNWPEYQAKEMETISTETERSDMEGKLYYEVFNEDRDMEDNISNRFESFHRKADEMGMLSLANEIDKGFPLEQKHVNLRPLENDETLPETILASDSDHTVTYSEDMDLYFVYRKVGKEDIVRDIEGNGISSDATREVLDVARENELKNHPTGLKQYVESMKDNTDVLSGDLTLLPKYSVAHRAFEDSLHLADELDKVKNSPNEYDRGYKTILQKDIIKNSELLKSELKKGIDTYKKSMRPAHEDSNIETNVVADAKHIAATGVPMNRAEKIAKMQADGMVHEDIHREQDEQAAREQKEKEQQQRKEEEKRKQETEKKESKPSMAVSHAAILLAALTQAEENKGIWMNKGYRQNASFLYSQTPIQGYNNVIMNLHAEQQGYHTNVYTNFDGAKENGTPVLAGQQSLPFSWTNWKYVNQSDENVVLTSRQYHALAKEDRMLYAPRAERSAKIIFNIDQTTMPSAQYDAWIGIVKEKGDNNETLKIDKETSFFNQYSEISKKHPDVVILMHDGDVYKSYKGSARKINEAIGLPLGKAEYKGQQVDFVEFSRYKLDSYLTKLNAAKTRVALCDQLQSPRLVKSTVSPEKVLSQAYQTAQSFAKAEGMKYERVMVVQDAEYDVVSNTLKVSGMSTPGKMASADSIDKANDIYRKLAMITGTESRLDRSGRNHLTPIDDAKYDKLVQEVTAGVLMARQGLPATISKENMELIPYWKMEITENPRMMGIIERDVNNSIEVIDNLAMGEMPDYRKMRGKMPEKMPMRKEDYTVVKELNKYPSMENKEFVLVKDKVTNTASVILPKGASLKVDNEVQGMRKDRISVVLKKEGIENVTFHNAGGSLGLKEQNAFFKDKEISVVKLKQFEFIKREPIDVRPLIKKSEEPRIQRFRMIKDEDGKYFFHIKPEGEKGFCVAPEKKYVNSLFEAIKSHDSEEIAKMTKVLSGQFYKLATEHEDVKRDFITPRKVEGIDYGRIRGANISYTGTGKDDGVISAYIDGVRQTSPINKPQLDKFFCSDDKNAYKTALAAVVFEQLLRRGTAQEQDLGFNMQEEQDAGMKRSNSSDEEKSNDKSEGLKAEPSPERRGGMRMH